MRNHISLLPFIVLLLLSQSCITHFDSLEYYTKNYAPNNSSLKTNGFYYSSSDTTINNYWPNAIQEFYFINDGTFIYGSNHQSIATLDSDICVYTHKLLSYGPFGFYTIKNDTILVEYIVTDYPGFTRANRNTFKAIKTTNGITIFELNGKVISENWLFHANSCVPTHVNNWLRKHRKYRLK
jgi:hypothetical protein